jgi:hypothetical protein
MSKLSTSIGLLVTIAGCAAAAFVDAAELAT